MALETTLRLLAGFAAFRAVEDEALRLVALSADTRILRAGEVLFRRGDPAEGALIVTSGTVEMRGTGEPVVVRPPVLFGETALLAKTRRPATAVALAPASTVWVSRALYLRVLGEYPRSAVSVQRQVAGRVAALRDEYEAASRRMQGQEASPRRAPVDEPPRRG